MVLLTPHMSGAANMASFSKDHHQTSPHGLGGGGAGSSVTDNYLHGVYIFRLEKIFTLTQNPTGFSGLRHKDKHFMN